MPNDYALALSMLDDECWNSSDTNGLWGASHDDTSSTFIEERHKSDDIYDDMLVCQYSCRLKLIVSVEFTGEYVRAQRLPRELFYLQKEARKTPKETECSSTAKAHSTTPKTFAD